MHQAFMCIIHHYRYRNLQREKITRSWYSSLSIPTDQTSTEDIYNWRPIYGQEVLITDKLKWDDAKMYCQRAGGTMLYIKDQIYLMKVQMLINKLYDEGEYFNRVLANCFW